jgi:hypothetical protein
MLKCEGLEPFWDKRCLHPGEDWKVGFLRGLNSSASFVAFVSTAGLASARNNAIDHSTDNVLLEYQLALHMNDQRKQNGLCEFIVPILVGRVKGSTLTKFQDFNSALYSDSVEAQETPQQKKVRLLAK